MVRSISSESCWIGVGPEPGGSVSATYTGRSTRVPGGPITWRTSNHCTRSTTWIGEPTTKSAGRSRPQRSTTGPAAPAVCHAAAPTGAGWASDGPRVVAEPLRQHLQQLLTRAICGVGRRDRGDDNRCRPVAGRRDRQDDAEGTDGHEQGGDQHRPRRAVGVGLGIGLESTAHLCSACRTSRIVVRMLTLPESADTNLPGAPIGEEVTWSAASPIAHSASSASSG